MKTVILTSGPRGSGKSTFVDLVQKAHPDIKFMSRDKLLMEIFGKTGLDPYLGEHEYAKKVFQDKLKNVLAEKGNFKLIVDYWNGFSSDRQSLIKMFRRYGAERVICWQFILPLDVCLGWFFKKSDSRGYTQDGISRDYKLYYQKARDIEEDGFNAVYYINPLQLTIPGFPLI